MSHESESSKSTQRLALFLPAHSQYFPPITKLFHSHTFSKDNHVINFANDMRFGLINIDREGVRKKCKTGHTERASSDVGFALAPRYSDFSGYFDSRRLRKRQGHELV